VIAVRSREDEDDRVIAWLREALGESEQWAELARVVVILRRRAEVVREEHRAMALELQAREATAQDGPAAPPSRSSTYGDLVAAVDEAIRERALPLTVQRRLEDAFYAVEDLEA
jgi:hypothetical protein